MCGKLSEESSKQSEEMNEKLCTELYPALVRYCCFLSKNKWDGEEIAQETILKALEYYQETNKLSVRLLNKIAYHHWIDLIRRRKYESHENVFAEIPIKDPTIFETVEKLTQQFTPKQAIIFMLKEAFQYKTSEIAELLTTSETAVKSSLHRAKKRLMQNDSFNMVPFWNDAEYALLPELFYESLRVQDPAILIRALPNIQSLMEDSLAPKLAEPTMIASYTPSTVLSMAA